MTSAKQNKTKEKKIGEWGSDYKSTMVEADVEPDSSLSNSVDEVPQDFHLNTFVTHREKRKLMQLSKSKQTNKKN